MRWFPAVKLLPSPGHHESRAANQDFGGNRELTASPPGVEGGGGDWPLDVGSIINHLLYISPFEFYLNVPSAKKIKNSEFIKKFLQI
jgi:hypothetical protein